MGVYVPEVWGVTEIHLTPAEMVIATTVAAMRHAEALHSHRADRHGLRADDDGLAKHMLGAAGEIAVARLLGRYWGGDVCTFKRADIGTSVQVRTRSRDDYDLIVRHDDADGDVFILVTGSLSRLTVRGWVYGHEAKRPEYLAPHGGRPEAYFVPQSALRPVGAA